MAELSKIFKSNDLYEAWRNEKEIPSNVLAVVLNGDGVDKVAFGTNDITGEYTTFEVADNSAEVEELEEQVEKLEQVTNHPSYITKLSWENGAVSVVPFARDNISISVWEWEGGKAKLTITFDIKNTQYQAFTFDGYKNNLIYYNNNGYTFTPNWISENKTTGKLVGEFLVDLDNDRYLEVMAADNPMITIIFEKMDN